MTEAKDETEFGARIATRWSNHIKPQDLLIDIHVLVVTFHVFIGIVCLTTNRLHLTVPC